MENEGCSNCLGCLLCIYLAISELMAAVFFREYCLTDSIARILFIDPFLAEIKGLLWFVFIWQY